MDKEEIKALAAKRSSEVNKGNTNSSKKNRLLKDTHLTESLLKMMR